MEHRIIKLSIFLVNKLLPSFLEFVKMLPISKWPEDRPLWTKNIVRFA